MREEEVSCRLPKSLKEKPPLTGDVTKCSLRQIGAEHVLSYAFIPMSYVFSRILRMVEWGKEM